MVDVIVLEPGEALPDEKGSVLVGPTEDGSGMMLDRSWTYLSYLPNVSGARASRIADAVTYAEEQGLRRIYVIEAGLTEYAARSDTNAVMPLKVEADTG